MIIFIDTNVYLGYYKKQKGVLTTLKAMKKYLSANSAVKLILPRQIRDEFFRNRNALISKALKAFEDFRSLESNFLYATKEIQGISKSVTKEIRILQEKIKKDFIDENSEINKTIESLFGMATLIDEEDDVFNQAYKRMLKGNPPGKDGSIGDAIVWETLLKDYNKETVYLITDDGDWYDEINGSQLKSFLLKEWGAKDAGKIQAFRHLGAFLKEIAKVPIPKEIIDQEKTLPPSETYTVSSVFPVHTVSQHHSGGVVFASAPQGVFATSFPGATFLPDDNFTYYPGHTMSAAYTDYLSNEDDKRKKGNK